MKEKTESEADRIRRQIRALHRFACDCEDEHGTFRAIWWKDVEKILRKPRQVVR